MTASGGTVSGGANPAAADAPIILFVAHRVTRLVPRFPRDGVCSCTAKSRDRLFVRRETCRAPGPDQAGRIL